MKTQKTNSEKSLTANENTSRAPKADAPETHAVGAGRGAAGGGIAGAVVGAAVGGPIGAGVGAVVGAISGSVVGEVAAETLNPTTEHEFWRKEHRNRPYFVRGTPYEQYSPAFQYGWESCASHPGKTFKDVEPELARDWERRRGQSKLRWENVKDATRDAWQRVEQTFGGDCCKPGVKS
jgi:hypothetical protein